ACSALRRWGVALRSLRTLSVPATAMAAAPPSTSPKVTAHEFLQATGCPLRQDARTRDTLSTCRASLGRSHRFRPRAGSELAVDGLRFADPLGRLCLCTGLAVGARDRCALGGAGRQSRSGADR